MEGVGGSGGFGAGQGSTYDQFGTLGDYACAGGGGLGAGGALFIHTGAHVIIQDATFTNNSVSGGASSGGGYEPNRSNFDAVTGKAYGQDIFLVSGGILDFQLKNDVSCYAIGGNHSQGGFSSTNTSGVFISSFDSQPHTLTLSSSGLTSDDGLFDGQLQIGSHSTLVIDSDYCLGHHSVQPLLDGGTLHVNQTLALPLNRTLIVSANGGTLSTANQADLNIEGTIIGRSGTLLIDDQSHVRLAEVNVENGHIFTLQGNVSQGLSFTKRGSGQLNLVGSQPNSITQLSGLLVLDGECQDISVSSSGTLHLHSGSAHHVDTFGSIIINANSVTLNRLRVYDGSEMCLRMSHADQPLLITESLIVDQESLSPVTIEMDLNDYQRYQEIPLIHAGLITLGSGPIEVTGLPSGMIHSLMFDHLEDDAWELKLIAAYPHQIDISGCVAAPTLSGLASYLNDVMPVSLLGQFVNMTPEQVAETFQQLSPAKNAMTHSITTQVVSQLSQTAMQPSSVSSGPNSSFRRTLRSGRVWAVDHDSNHPAEIGSVLGWMSGTFHHIHHRGTDSAPGFTAHSQSAIGGFDYHQENYILTVSAGATNTHYHASNDSVSGHVQGRSMGPSVYYRDVHAWYVQPSCTIAFQEIHNTRSFSVLSNSYSASFEQPMWCIAPQIEIGKEWVQTELGSITPFISTTYLMNWAGAYSETGDSPYNMSQSSHYSTNTRIFLGTRFEQVLKYDWGTLECKEKISYLNDRSSHQSGEFTMQGSSSSITLSAYQDQPSFFAFGADIYAHIGHENPFDLTVSYAGEWNSDRQTQSLQFTFSHSF